MRSNLDDYRLLPYERTWETRVEGPERYFIVRLADIPQVSGAGETKDEALDHLCAAFDDYVAWRLEDGLDVAPPSRTYHRPRPMRPAVSRDFCPTKSRSTLQIVDASAESTTDRAAASYQAEIDCREVACA